MILSLIISTGYSTGYTSLLTHPKHTKPINTVVDMLEQKIRVGFLYATPQIKNELMKSHNENYIALSKNFVLEKESGRQYKNAENMKNAHMIKVKKITSINYVNKHSISYKLVDSSQKYGGS